MTIPTQLEAILAEREACAVTAEEYPSLEYADIAIVRGIATAIRNRPTPASEEVGEVGRDNIRAAIANAFVAGCQAVHENHQEDRDPDFSEAASDYASDAMSVFDMLHPFTLARP